MKLQSESARKALLQMIDETGMSTDEVANSSGVGVSSLYRILDLENKTTQRATIRKVSSALGYLATFSGDTVTVKKIGDPSEVEADDLKRLSQRLEKLRPKDREKVIEMIETFITLIEKDSPE